MKSFQFFIFLLICGVNVFAQGDTLKIATPVKINKNLTVAYALTIDGSKRTGIEETYNGGNKTIFISDAHARVRLVSLMRIQSLYFNFADSNNYTVAILKESGKDKYKSNLSRKDWEKYNSKYEGLQCEFTTDSLIVLEYPCKKAVLKLMDGRQITAWYTSRFNNPLLANIDPAFECLPGLVLQYQYSDNGRSISYTATSITENIVNDAIFKIPAKGYVVRKFIAAEQN